MRNLRSDRRGRTLNRLCKLPHVWKTNDVFHTCLNLTIHSSHRLGCGHSTVRDPLSQTVKHPMSLFTDARGYDLSPLRGSIRTRLSPRHLFQVLTAAYLVAL